MSERIARSTTRASRVRPFAPEDRPALEAIYLESRAEADWLPSAAKERADFARDTRGELLLVAVAREGEVQGFVSFWEPESFVHHLYVRRGFRGTGIGKMLLHALAARQPMPWRLKCLRANEAALAFYSRQGWKEVGSDAGEDGPFLVLEKHAI